MSIFGVAAQRSESDAAPPGQPLPLESSLMHSASALSDSAAGAPGRRRVLVVDDDEGNATLLTRLLQNSGYEVRMACDGAEAVATASSYQPHVVFLDIGMPGMNGFEVARQLRQRGVETKPLLVAVSGYQEDDHAMDDPHAFDHWLVKPVPLAALQEIAARSA